VLPRNLGLTFAGGGNRALFQIGLMERWWPRLESRIGAISACSAGASMSVTWLTGRQPATHRYWLGRREGITRNFDWSRVLRGNRPTPHEPIYRATMHFALAEGGFERIRALPFPLLILAAGFPSLLPASVATGLGMLSYSVERQLNPGKLHPRSGKRLGFTSVAVDARTCESAEELVDLIIASSATPPFTSLGRFRGRRLADGGMVDNAPAFVAETVRAVERTLVLLTRPYPPESIGWQGQRLYLAPSVPVAINRWDYTSVDRIEATLAQGRREADLQAGAFEDFLR
jgi:predicted acylesterase/phospholipase RssA